MVITNKKTRLGRRVFQQSHMIKEAAVYIHSTAGLQTLSPKRQRSSAYCTVVAKVKLILKINLDEEDPQTRPMDELRPGRSIPFKDHICAVL